MKEQNDVSKINGDEDDEGRKTKKSGNCCLAFIGIDLFVVAGCCQEHQVATDCQALLCGGNSSVLQPDQDMLHCFSDVDKVFQCLSG